MNASPRSRTMITVLAVIPLAVASIMLIYSYRLTGRFKPNPQLQARLQEVTLTKKQHYGPAYRIASSEFVCAGTAKWSGGGGGIWVRDGWTTGKATFRAFLEELSPRGLYGQEEIDFGGAHTRKGPIYVEVTDVFGVSLDVKSIKMSSSQLAWLGIQRRISSGVFRVIDVVFLMGYVVFLALWRARRYGMLRSRDSLKEDAQPGAPVDADEPRR